MHFAILDAAVKCRHFELIPSQCGSPRSRREALNEAPGELGKQAALSLCKADRLGSDPSPELAHSARPSADRACSVNLGVFKTGHRIAHSVISGIRFGLPTGTLANPASIQLR